MRPNLPTVFIVDDDPGVRRSTAMLLESADLCCEAFGSADEFLGTFRPERCGCVVLDLHMPGTSGMEQLREKQVALPVLIVSGTGTIPVAVAGMKLGVIDFLVKPADPDLLIAKVHAAILLDAERRANAAEVNQLRVILATLTARETETLRLLVAGMANKRVAMELGISIKTVENHRASIMLKTGALNVADLTRMSMLAYGPAGPR
jgi:FixJ family two-component response regulator